MLFASTYHSYHQCPPAYPDSRGSPYWSSRPAFSPTSGLLSSHAGSAVALPSSQTYPFRLVVSHTFYCALYLPCFTFRLHPIQLGCQRLQGLYYRGTILHHRQVLTPSKLFRKIGEPRRNRIKIGLLSHIHPVMLIQRIVCPTRNKKEKKRCPPLNASRSFLYLRTPLWCHVLT